MLMIGRLASNMRWASSLSSVAAAGVSMLPAFGGHDPLLPLVYLLPGLVIDLGFSLFKQIKPGIGLLLLFSALGAIAHVGKPILRFAISLFTPWQDQSLISGLFYSLFTHFIFGFVGTAIGITMVLVARRKSTQ